MEVTESGMTMEVREEQPEKAYRPMEVTKLLMVTEVREVHLAKARSPMEVTESGMTTSLISSPVSASIRWTFPSR